MEEWRRRQPSPRRPASSGAGLRSVTEASVGEDDGAMQGEMRALEGGWRRAEV